MTAKATAAPDVVMRGRTVGGTHGCARWTGSLALIEDYRFVVLDESGAVVEECGRCADAEATGTARGHIREFSHVLGGVCFECSGVGHGAVISGGLGGAQEIVRKRLLARAARARAADRRAAGQAAAGAAWVTANADLAARLIAILERSWADEQYGLGLPFELVSFANVVRAGSALSEKQTAFAMAMVLEQEQWDADADLKAAAAAAAVHLGVVGEPLEVTGTVQVVLPIESRYGRRSRLVVIQDAGGNRVKMFTAAAWARELAAGQVVTVTGTVSEHDHYDDVAQTLVRRPRLAGVARPV